MAAENFNEAKVAAAQKRFESAQRKIISSGGMTMKGGGTQYENEYASAALILMQAGKLPKIRAKYRYAG